MKYNKPKLLLMIYLLYIVAFLGGMSLKYTFELRYGFLNQLFGAFAVVLGFALAMLITAYKNLKQEDKK